MSIIYRCNVVLVRAYIGVQWARWMGTKNNVLKSSILVLVDTYDVKSMMPLSNWKFVIRAMKFYIAAYMVKQTSKIQAFFNVINLT